MRATHAGCWSLLQLGYNDIEENLIEVTEIISAAPLGNGTKAFTKTKAKKVDEDIDEVDAACDVACKPPAKAAKVGVKEKVLPVLPSR